MGSVAGILGNGALIAEPQIERSVQNPGPGQVWS